MDEINKLSKEKNVTAIALCKAVSMPRATYYRQQKKGTLEKKPAFKPSNAIDNQEKDQIIELLHSERFIDSTPYQTFYTLLDEGHYYCSIRTMYRLLTEHSGTKDRRIQRNHRNAIKPELIATTPNQVWSWDITKLLSTKRLVYYHLYVILDIFSRYAVGWLIADRECQDLAYQLIEATALRQGVQKGSLTLHADNGPSMTSGTVGDLLENMGIIKSHNRPYTSNDNPFSESQFKTLKYCPQFPKRFDNIKEAELFSQDFFKWYNSMHYHSGRCFLTPESVHYGLSDGILDKRHDTLMSAYIENPSRFNNKPPVRKILKPAYINPPQTVIIQGVQK
ncbi:putative transposase OrfB (plasmid) [Piscirickettsia salmonis]|uniref:Transposase n=3 Tax=Piscirickettsia salmonis TaxID=1238 RepID=A0A0K2L8B8_PISSA|nr:IS3 family transposase [Piscirickettsia salmonis]WGZ70899.1 IS3 family transposase [Piscirickettsia salmonis EM-90]ALB22432.1 transposase [Piscirickettsia salmonis]ALB24345.1 transposase [Piscirickettsia salmonis]ALB24411.1 transposase [Piscirickettsia salmonis]ALT18324.1 hypothetical protein PSLF89_05340 [Piscirickettsia salmonis LF-89 = ATCC VR-1361]